MLEWLQRTRPCPLRTLHSLLCQLPGNALFEREEAPVFHDCLVRALPADQQERGQNGPRDRACPALLVVHHSHPAAVQAALQLLDGQFPPTVAPLA